MGIITLTIFTVLLLNQAELGYGHNTSMVLNQLTFQIYDFVGNAWKIFSHRRFEIEQRVKVESLVLGQLIPLLKAGVKGSSPMSTNYLFELLQSIQTQLSSIQEIAMKRIEIYIEAIDSIKMDIHPSTEIILRLKLEQIELSPPTWNVKFNEAGPLPNDLMNEFILEPEVMESVVAQILGIGGMVKILRSLYLEKERDDSNYVTSFSSSESRFELECDDKICEKPRDVAKEIVIAKEKMGSTIEKLIPLQAKFIYLLNNPDESEQDETLEFMDFQKKAGNKIEKLAAKFRELGHIKIAELLEDFTKKSLSFEYIASDIRIFSEV